MVKVMIFKSTVLNDVDRKTGMADCAWKPTLIRVLGDTWVNSTSLCGMINSGGMKKRWLSAGNPNAPGRSVQASGVLRTKTPLTISD